MAFSTNKYVTLIPTIGIVLFLIIYIYATFLYPGGSEMYPRATGFDWIYNYWCDLIQDVATNGELNPSKPFAVAAMILLCGLIAIFSFQFADTFEQSRRWRYAIKIFGGLSMFFGALIFTPLHNSMIGISSLLATVPVIGIFRGLLQAKITKLIVMGILSAILLAMCNVLYYSGWLIEWLPLIQKLAMMAVLGWVVLVNLHVLEKQKRADLKC